LPGIEVLPFIIAIAFWGMFPLTSANCIKHYDLLREKRENGL
jgi:alkane 1-monooxygenase